MAPSAAEELLLRQHPEGRAEEEARGGLVEQEGGQEAEAGAEAGALSKELQGGKQKKNGFRHFRSRGYASPLHQGLDQDRDSRMPGGGLETARRDTYNSSLAYYNGTSQVERNGLDIVVANGGYYESPKSTPPIHKFSPPAFTSLIDLCRDITALQVVDNGSSKVGEDEEEDSEEALKSPEEITEDEFILLYNEEQDNKDKLRRSSSLKSARTSGGQKKIVRFADVLGLDLADVHTFLDEVPRIPKSAFKDLKNKDYTPRDASPRETRNDRTLVPRFVQPGSQPGFAERLVRNKVLLEHAYVTSTLGLSVRGTVRVANLDFNKHVAVRYSSDGWKSFTEIQASYVETPHDGLSDRFGFTIPVFASIQIGGRLEFAVKYIVLGEESWDNNTGQNYVFDCVPEGPPKPVTSAYVPSSIALETWGSFY